MMNHTRNDLISAVGIVIALAAMFSVFLYFRSLSPVSQIQSTNNINAILTVLPTCYTSASPNSISFSSVTPGKQSGSVAVTVGDNYGNVDSFPLISGGDWSISGSAPTFGVSNTLYYNGISSTFIRLLSTTANTYALVNPISSITNVITFAVNVPAQQAAGTYNQIIIITNTC